MAGEWARLLVNFLNLAFSSGDYCINYFSCFTLTWKRYNDRCQMLEGTEELAGGIASFQLLPSQNLTSEPVITLIAHSRW